MTDVPTRNERLRALAEQGVPLPTIAGDLEISPITVGARLRAWGYRVFGMPPMRYERKQPKGFRVTERR